jgi:hypothetical protein
MGVPIHWLLQRLLALKYSALKGARWHQAPLAGVLAGKRVRWRQWQQVTMLPAKWRR